MSKEPLEGLDEDVESEKERVLSGGASRDLIRIENLTKVSLSEVAEFNNYVWICTEEFLISLKKRWALEHYSLFKWHFSY